MRELSELLSVADEVDSRLVTLSKFLRVDDIKREL